MGRLARRLFSIPLAEVRVERRGFRAGDDRVRSRLESIGETFVAGYHAALEEPGHVSLARHLDAIETERRGFAYEGAAMALAILDAVAPWRRSRWRAFLDGPGEPHAYMVHVGAGWAMARVGLLGRRLIASMDPLLEWLAFDGFGFHEGYFRWPRYREGGPAPRSLSGYARRAFDQGVGRSLWFVEGADPERIARAIDVFPHERRADLWSGIGLAAAYAGGADLVGLESLPRRAGEHAPWLAQGAAFAAKARERAGNPAEHTRAACAALCGLAPDAAARTTDEALPGDGARRAGHHGEPAYEAWRRRIRDRMAEHDDAWRSPCPVR